MAALAIDIVTLYVARSEIQRAADAAALAGAKAVADSGITTLLLTDPNFSVVKPWAQFVATAQINAVLQNNLVSGGAPAVVSAPVDWSRQGDPHITVNLRRDNLPTFFSKIWKRGSASVTAAATAEAYNPANVPNFTPIAPKAVKPWLIANADPNNAGNPFITPAGAVEPGATVVGELLNLTADCQPGLPNCQLIDNPPSSAGPRQVDYVPALVTLPGVPNPNVCPPCAGATDYEQSIECADVTTSYQVLSCGGGANHATWDSSVNPGGLNGFSALGAECLIHATAAGMGQGQDKLDSSPWPANPMQITAESGLQLGSLVTTSSSIVTIPIIDITYGGGGFPASGAALTVVGFLQAFINQVHGGGLPSHPGDIEVYVLNVAGCSATPNGANPVVGGSGSSPVPVRLITPP